MKTWRQFATETWDEFRDVMFGLMLFYGFLGLLLVTLSAPWWLVFLVKMLVHLVKG
jgi:hypothetical protein